MLPPPRRSTSRGFQSLDLLISGFLQDLGFQIPDFHICTPEASKDSRFPDLQDLGFQIPDFQICTA